MIEIVNVQSLATGLLSTAIIAVGGLVVKQSHGMAQLIAANNAATKYLLKDRITQKCQYHQEQGFIAPNDAEVLQEMFREYTNLGGNSYVHGMVERTLTLSPIKKTKERNCND